ncbi:MAG: hypothetical protein HY909_04155 [Deltaproteobacteria bacterium]|nr:hypothetical protein [Deltaproteobacteria bacterium]
MALLVGTASAGAQDMGMGQTPPSGGSSSGSSGGGGGGESITSTAGPTDHSRVVGRLGLTYFGATTVAVLAGGGNGLPTYDSGSQGSGTVPPPTGMMMMGGSGSATLQTVGIRYWVNNQLGIEGGLAFGLSSGTRSFTRPEGSGTRTDTDDDPGFFGVGFQFGVPLMLAEAKHVNIQLAPFLAFHFASASITRGSTAMDARDESSNALILTMGGNAQAEVHLGFLGMPQVSLTARFGLQLRFRSATQRVVPRATSIPTEFSQSAFGLGTTVGPNHSFGEIFAGSIAVTYYWGSPG